MLMSEFVWRVCRSLLGLLVAVAAMAACSADVDPNPSPAANGAPARGPEHEPVLDPQTVALADPHAATSPLAGYRPGAAKDQIIDRARELVGNACMRGFGFAPPAPGWAHVNFDFNAFSLWARYGIWDPIAAETGYLPPMSFDESKRYVPPFTGEANQVYSGEVKEYNGRPVPAAGCSGEMTRTVMQPTGARQDLAGFLGDLDEEAMRRSAQDSRVVPLVAAWRDCMKQHGWDYEDPMAPFSYWNQPPRRGADKYVKAGDISTEEKASARDDLGCKRSTMLLGTWLAADVAYQHLIVERESERLREYSQYMDKVLANANRIITEGVR